ncbi:GntR family transcriptional regulator [Streptomyces yokosukanensis]|uniref:GntR family transcriptional regulator n=1 Tax=Streptomyces yokosukanensis TaxID=67386 RepID=A0A101NWV1_9ACTN|nr:GntR family transcriptional regulator [Streptomyces yokosukanensis]KUN00593.1 GntR family transcriptional regulator [Streptomyces yokosukanensis]
MAAREHIERAPSMYLQVAQRMATDIKRGRYQAGDLLPSETEMVNMYGIGKHTARAAVAELRRMGLVESQQGKGSIVLPSGGVLPATRVDRSIERTTKGSWRLPDMAETEPPAVTRTALDGPPALLLDQQDQDAISVDRMLHDRKTGARMAHRVLIPFATAADVPTLAEQPDAEITDLYRQLAEAGLTLSFTEHVTARAPYPDERTALGLSDASPLLITYRVTTDTDQDRPLLCEELKAPAATCQLTYPVTPTKPAAKRAARRRPESA